MLPAQPHAAMHAQVLRPNWKPQLGMEMVECTCPVCGRSLSFIGSSRGRVSTCPHCGADIIVPTNAETEARMLPIPIRTERLLLRQLQSGDRNALLELMSDEESFRFIEWDPLDFGEVDQWLRTERSCRLSVPGGHLCLGIELIAESVLVGFVSVYLLPECEFQAGFTVMIARRYRNREYGTEAVRAVIGFCLTELRLHRVAASCDSRNAAARRLIENAGLRLEGQFIEDKYVKDEWISTFFYAVLDREFSP